MDVSLQPITKENVSKVYMLEVETHQKQFVAPNPWSLAQALAEYEVAWPRAIVADDVVVGFLMLEIDPNEEDGQNFWLWRLMVDASHQGKGIGRAALALAVDEVRGLGAKELYTSWVPGEGSPESFYLGFGFEPTGELDEDEIVARLAIPPG